MTSIEIRKAASEIAQASWDDRILDKGPLADQIEAVASQPSHGADGDLTSDDRKKLRDLAAIAKKRGL